jgi:uncharacterized protein (DUF934 family)
MKGLLQIRLLTSAERADDECQGVVTLSNDEDPFARREAIMQANRVELSFPQFTDGRAYSQAWIIRRRFGFAGDLRATGDVLADQLVQMVRTGFSSAVLKDSVDLADAHRQLERFAAFYQGDAVSGSPFRGNKTPVDGPD